jgi:hypothetical protein
LSLRLRTIDLADGVLDIGEVTIDTGAHVQFHAVCVAPQHLKVE